MKRWKSCRSVKVKVSSFGATCRAGVISSGVGLDVGAGADEDEEDPVALDGKRLHLSPRFTHLAQGASSSHLFAYQYW